MIESDQRQISEVFRGVQLPPNPGSLRFHQRQGFREVGRQAHDDGAVQVIKLEKTLPLAMAAE